MYKEEEDSAFLATLDNCSQLIVRSHILQRRKAGRSCRIGLDRLVFLVARWDASPAAREESRCTCVMKKDVVQLGTGGPVRCLGSCYLARVKDP